MIFRVILTSNGRYKKTLHICKTRDTSFINYHALIQQNKGIKFPKRFINTLKIKPVRYKICVVKPTEPNDVFRTIKDDYGKTYVEKPIGDWTILASEDYNLEETFWIYGMNSKLKRPNIDAIIKRLFVGIYKKKMVKQVIVVHNKLIIYNEEQFEMIICKCKEDAQRLHHTLNKAAKKQKIKNLMFMGTASKANVGKMYDIIKEKTGWPINKVKRSSTRP